ncbi:class III lanthionine synthetase LanKC N-terminal domain-containing protein [Spirosoma radiotolerans]|uniref:RamC N-terminal domain-containing protein n=1 Tax=Spirosoma radiotolerans TaxID=1379870 RepID=A0A0E3V5M1_9BACT|nr:hypothetical protein [Spirosoma radiotolerans]AKD53751.1 hypothetical protein SD10_01385 [Spirosoma radiotolerans]
MEREPIRSFYEKVKALDKKGTSASGPGYEARSTGQRSIGGNLTPMSRKSSGLFGGKRSKIKTLIENYNKTNNQQNKKVLLLEIRKLQVEWLKTAHKKVNNAKGDKETNKYSNKLSEIISLENEIYSEAIWLDNGGRIIIDDDKKEQKRFSEPKSISIDPEEYKSALKHFLSDREYKDTGQYWVKNNNSFDPHVGWKAHIGATLESAFTVLEKVLPILDRHKFNHKVDTEPGVFGETNKFITIYPSENEEDWGPLIDDLEKAVGHGIVSIPGEWGVGSLGHIGMRHGQLTALTTKILETNGIKFTKVRVNEKGNVIYQLSNPSQYDGRVGDGIMITKNDKPGSAMFVTDTKHDKFCPAMLHEGKIYPDPRMEANPFGFALPRGVKSFLD